jgi:hypothetical protein
MNTGLRTSAVVVVSVALGAFGWWGCGAGSGANGASSDASAENNGGGTTSDGGAGADSSTFTEATNDANTVQESDFCDAIASGICTQFLPCCDSLDAGTDPASCRSQVRAWCAPEVASPNLVYDPAAAADCVNFYQNGTGNLTVENCKIVHPATSNTCAQAFVGTLPLGAPCVPDTNNDNECAPSDAGLAGCNGLAEGGPRCTIIPYVGQGQACDDVTTWCRPPLQCNTEQQCVLPGPLGSACTEASDCTSANCVDASCAPTAPIVVDVGFCQSYAITPDGG